MNEKIKKLAHQAIELQKRIKADTENLQNIKKEIIKESQGANSSYAVNLITGKVRVTKSKKLRLFLLDKKCRIATDPNISDQDRKIKCDRLNFLIELIEYKFVI